ncbi:TadE/TadG family type IV pilus assembly protein [Asticcacaulis machinosus]|uniref:Tad domain-containing protein n=1 Tax=Asticcacaulis machinosus TaxID=2984211 RepID=A0ABT5HHZ7_9CAUL|nr:TadE/TadG family type IV pilus assembly protein [Asticcacaulis machinosus]MDC7675623.1 Tad domain-containing protein [Asticcacaulis machinosus]
MQKRIFSGLWQRIPKSVKRFLETNARKTIYSLKPFCGHQAGNVAVIFGLSAMTLVVAAGGGTDVVRQMDVRAKMQDAADAAVLRAVMSSKMTDEQREIAADQAFENNFGVENVEKYDAEGTIGKEVIGNTTHVTYTVDATIENLFLQIIGIETTTVTVVAKAQSQMRKSEIAFVLDVTGSMSTDATRIANLKSSMNSVLLSLLTNGVNASETKVAIVPFNPQVRVDKGTSYSYIDYGVGSNSEGCSSSPGDSNLCSYYRDIYGKVCYQSSNTPSDTAACKATAKFYYKSYKSGGNDWFDVMVTASGGGKNFSYTDQIQLGSKTSTSTGGCSTNSETGVETCTQGGKTTTSTTYTLKKQNGTTSGTPSTSGFTYAGDKSLIKYTNSYGSGYGSREAQVKEESGLKSSDDNKQPKKIVHYPVVPDSKSTWTGCITDREQSYDVSADAYTVNTKALYKAVSCATNNLGVIKGLTTDITTTNTYVQALKTGDSTNVTIGIQWGMEVLSPAEPFASTVAFKDDTTLKYMIVITDGENTKNRWSTKSEDIDKRTKLACEAANAQGITVFVVRVMEGNSQLLKDCATKDEYYYDLTSASQLNTALSSVFEAIKKTRLTQ